MRALAGVPSALFGSRPATDPRWFCLAIGVSAVALALCGLRPEPRVAQLVLNPVTLLLAVVSGKDVAVLGLQLLGVALVACSR